MCGKKEENKSCWDAISFCSTIHNMMLCCTIDHLSGSIFSLSQMINNWLHPFMQIIGIDNMTMSAILHIRKMFNSSPLSLNNSHDRVNCGCIVKHLALMSPNWYAN